MNISVILTSYNHEKFLARSIESVLNQTYKDFEFIIVDDCSTDASWDIIKAYKQKYPYIITLRHEYNWGGGVVADTVRNYATGDYVAIHHSDDLWEREKLQKQVDILKEHPEYVAVFTNASAIDEEGNAYEDENGFYYNLFAVENRSRYEWLNHFFFYGNCLCHPSIIVKKSVYEEDGFFRKGLKQIPDFVKWIQICKKYEIYVIPEVLVKFRVRTGGQNTSGMRLDTQIRSTVELFLMLQEYLDIKNQQEFLAIFPEAKKYCTEDYFSPEYVLGRICTEEGMPAYTRLFGVEQLYKVLNDSTQMEQLQRKEFYSVREFIKANGLYDIFGMLPRAFEQTRSVYYDCGDGYNADYVVREKYTLNQEAVFHMCATIRTDSERTIRSLRFDPAEGVLVKSKIESIIVNGERVEFAAENALQKVNDEDVFINMDPIYSLTLSSKLMTQNMLVVEIRGRVSRLTDAEIGNVVTGFMYYQRNQQNEYNRNLLQTEELLARNSDLEKNHQVLSDQLNKIAEEKECLEKDYMMISGKLDKVSEEKECLEKDYMMISGELDKVSEDKKCLEKKHEITVEELENLQSTRWYKMMERVHQIGERWRKSE